MFKFFGSQTNHTIYCESTKRKCGDPKLQSKESLQPSEILVFRILVLVSLFATAALCGSLSYIILRKSEEDHYKSQYDSLTQQFKRSAEDFIRKFHASTDEIATIAAIHFPNASTWPNAHIPKYYLLNEELNKVTGGTYSGVWPIVKPNEIYSFQNYSKDFIDSDPYMSSFFQYYSLIGFGIYNFDENSIFHEYTGYIEGSDRRFFAPAVSVASSVIESGILMLNIRAIPFVASAMDDVMDCVDAGHTSCASMTHFTSPNQPDTFLLRPIFSMDGREELVGFSSVNFNWEVELSKISPGVSALDVVLESNSGVQTFAIDGGVAVHKGEGDHHNKRFNNMRVKIYLRVEDTEAANSAVYILNVYPTAEFVDDYLSETPLYASIGSISLIVFSSIIFFSYDYFVKEEDRAKIQLLNAKRDFVRFISHEIRTPLNTLSVGLSLMEEGITGSKKMSNEEVLDLNREMQSGTETAVSVLNDLLNFDKLEAGEFGITQVAVPVWSLVESVFKSFRMTAVHKDISMTIDFERGDNLNVSRDKLVIIGDHMKIAQVFRNLISNALKFTNRCGSISVKVSCKTADELDTTENQALDPLRDTQITESNLVDIDKAIGKVVISVTDTGYGISQGDIKKVFSDGMQFKPNELQAGQGSGLGLFLSYKIVQLHHGRIWVTSEGENKGTSFFVELPLYAASDSFTLELTTGESHPPSPHSFHGESSIVPAASPGVLLGSLDDTLEGSGDNADEMDSVLPPISQAPKKIEKLLVVDDTGSNRKMVCRILKNRGYQCLEAKDGKECIQIMTTENASLGIDCILMDFEMPELNGPDATKQLRAKGFTLPIIGLTGNVMVDDVNHFLICGADHVLAKPFQIDQFVGFLNQRSV